METTAPLSLPNRLCIILCQKIYLHAPRIKYTFVHLLLSRYTDREPPRTPQSRYFILIVNNLQAIEHRNFLSYYEVWGLSHGNYIFARV